MRAVHTDTEDDEKARAHHHDNKFCDTQLINQLLYSCYRLTTLVTAEEYCVIPVLPVIYLHFTCYIPAFYLLYTWVIPVLPVIYLNFTCCIPAFYLLYMPLLIVKRNKVINIIRLILY